MSAPFVPTIRVHYWQFNGFPLTVWLNVPSGDTVVGETGELIRRGTNLKSGNPVGREWHGEDAWIQAFVDMDGEASGLCVFEDGAWTLATEEQAQQVRPYIAGRLKRIGRALFEAAAQIPDHDAS